MLDLLQGAGIAAAIGIRPFLPVLLVGALASADLGIDFDGTDFAFLEEWPFLLGVLVLVALLDFATRRRADVDAGPVVWLLLALARRARRAAGRRLARRPRLRGRARHRRRRRRGDARLLRRALAVRRACAGGSTPTRRRVLPLYGEGAALAAAGVSVLFPPLAILVLAGLALAARRRTPPRAGEKYAGLRILAVKKLVLVVIDAMKPAMLERAVASGRAPTLKLLLEEGQHVDDCVAAFPSVTPVCAASIATGTGPDEHEIPGMNWYHRGEGRYVEYGTSFRASQSFGLRQSLTDTIYNMNLEHLSRDVRDGVRAARRRRRAHGRHDVPDVPRPAPPRGVGRHGAHPDRLDRLPPRGLRPEGALLRRHLRLAPHAVPVAARPAGHPRPALRLRRRVPGRARPVRLPAALAARQRHALAQERAVRAGRLAGRRRPPDRAADRRRRRAGARSSRTTR